ncbi:MAG TPA: hypothetical protein VK436_13370 [Methanocella sp.]|nr:hypothetical protein [Methanocella sp.]
MASHIVRLALVCTLLLLLAGIAVAESSILPAPEYMTTQSADHFTIKYNPEGKVDMTKVLKDSAAAYDKIDRFFLGYHNNTTVKIADSNEEYRAITGMDDVPDSIQAIDFSDEGKDTIIIKSPNILPDFRQIMTYHMAKNAERNMLRVYHTPPAWFDEGLAEYVASNITDGDRNYSADLAKQSRWMPLDQIDKIYESTTIYNMNSTDNKNARIQSFLLVERVGHIYGNLTLLDILTDFGQQGDLDNAFMKYTGQKPDDFNRELGEIMIGPQTATASAIPESDSKANISGHVFDANSDLLSNQTINATVSGMNMKGKGQLSMINLFGIIVIIIADLAAAAIIAYVRRKSVL